MEKLESNCLIMFKGETGDLNADELFGEAANALKDKYCNNDAVGVRKESDDPFYRSCLFCLTDEKGEGNEPYYVYAARGGISGKIVLSYGKKNKKYDRGEAKCYYDDTVEITSREEFALFMLSRIAEISGEVLEVRQGGVVFFAGREIRSCRSENNVATLKKLAEKDVALKAVYAGCLVDCADKIAGQDVEKAVDIYEKAVSVYESFMENATGNAIKKYALTVARAYVKRAGVNIRYDDHDVATDSLEKAVGLYVKYADSVAEDSDESAEAAELLVEESIKTRRADRVREIYDKAVAIREEMYEKQGSKHALPLAKLYETGIAVLNKERNATEEEICKLMNKTVSLEEDLAGSGEKEAFILLARAYGRLGNGLYGDRKFAARGAECFVKAVYYSEKSNVSLNIYLVRHELARYTARAGITLYISGKEGASGYLIRAASLFAEMSECNELFDYKDYLEVVDCICDGRFAGVEAEKNYEKTEELCHRSVDRVKRLYEGDEKYYVSAYGKALYVQGEFYLASQEYEKAAEIFEQSFSVISKGYGYNAQAFEFDYAEGATKVGTAHYYCGNYALAEKRLLEGLKVAEAFSDDYAEEGERLKAYILYSLANVYADSKDYGRAEERYLESIAKKEKLYAGNGARYAQSLAVSKYFLADVYIKTGEREKAVKYLSEAIEVLEKEGGELNAGKLAIYYSVLSGLEREAGDSEKASEHLKKSEFYSKRVSVSGLKKR